LTKLSLSDARRLLERGVFETDLKFFPRQCNNILKMRRKALCGLYGKFNNLYSGEIMLNIG